MSLACGLFLYLYVLSPHSVKDAVGVSWPLLSLSLSLLSPLSLSLSIYLSIYLSLYLSLSLSLSLPLCLAFPTCAFQTLFLWLLQLVWQSGLRSRGPLQNFLVHLPQIASSAHEKGPGQHKMLRCAFQLVDIQLVSQSFASSFLQGGSRGITLPLFLLARKLVLPAQVLSRVCSTKQTFFKFFGWSTLVS